MIYMTLLLIYLTKSVMIDVSLAFNLRTCTITKSSSLSRYCCLWFLGEFHINVPILMRVFSIRMLFLTVHPHYHLVFIIMSYKRRGLISKECMRDVKMGCFSPLVFQLLVAVSLLLMLCLKGWLQALPVVKESHIITLFVGFAAI